MNRFTSSPKIKEANPARPKLNATPRLRWPTLDECYQHADLDRFPSLNIEQARYQLGMFGAWSEEFADGIRNANERIWLIDGYLFKKNEGADENFATIFKNELVVTRAKDICLLAANGDAYSDVYNLLSELQNDRRRPPNNEGFTAEIRCVAGKKSALRLPHDRFAIIDSELWHWGANVGGTHQEVNAYSRGWPSDATGAEDYFKRLWNRASTLKC